MFDRRVKILLVVLAIPALAVVLRLVQLQIAQGAFYRSEAQRMLERPPRYFTPLRGEIQDHEGTPLAFDAPSWEICVRFEVIARDRLYLRSLARKLPPGSPDIDTLIEESWQAIARFSERPREELVEVADNIRRRVLKVKEQVSTRHGVEMVVLEEQVAHPIVRGLSQNRQAEAREALHPYPWVEVIGGQTRRYMGGPSLGHMLGYLNEVDAEDLENDPNRNDDLARYRAGDLHGAAGVEALAEDWLRGQRGREERDIVGNLLSPRIEPRDGRDFRLTISLPLQQMVYAKLEAAVKEIPTSTGGAAVILDVPTRQILALVSYPGYDPNLSPRERLLLETDELNRPAAFRALGENYPPGSIVKPMVLAGALTDGTVSRETTFVCTGVLHASVPDRFRCLGSHGSVGPVFSIQHSCNIFYYHLGEMLGVPRLAYWMTQAGLGRPPGTGIPRESSGGLPSAGGAGDARSTAIGQWQVQATPLQAANMMASIAAGSWREVTLWADDPRPRPLTPLGVSANALQIVREGMYEVVNTQGGTAYRHIHLENTGPYVLLGKTGSAEVDAGRTVERLYVCHFPDGSVREIVAANRLDLSLRFPETRKATVTGGRTFQRFPTEDMDPTHAWFGGYITTRDRYLESSNHGELNVALVVLIEFGGRGGGVTAPVASEIVQSLLDMHMPLREGRP